MHTLTRPSMHPHITTHMTMFLLTCEHSVDPPSSGPCMRRLTETGLSGAQPASTTPAVPPVPLTIPNPLTGGRRAPGAPKLNLRDKILVSQTILPSQSGR